MGAIVVEISESRRFKGMDLANGVVRKAVRQLNALGYHVDIHEQSAQPDSETIAPAKPKRRKKKDATATCDDC